MISNFTEQGRSYAGQQRGAWYDSVKKSMVSEIMNLAAQDYDEPDKIAYQLENYKFYLDTIQHGLDNRGELNKVFQNVAETRVDGYLAHNRIADARDAFEESRDMLGDRANAVKVRIDARADALQALLAPEQMKAVADIMRESPYAKSALEAAKLNEDLPADMDGLIERAEDDALERSAIEGELERLRAEMTRAVTSAPHLMGQITSGTDAETSVGQYVDAQLGLIVRRARELARMGVPVSDTLSRVSFEGPVEDEQGRTVTPEEADALAQRNAEEEALAPFWDAVWGKLDANSLRVDFPDARREPAYQHGRGLFARKGEGLAVDELADELRERGLLDSDADSSSLVEKLKEMERPRRKAGTIQDSTLFASIQDLQDPSIEWKQGFHNIPARPVVIPVTGIGAKNANARAKETYGGKSFPLADGTEIRVGSDGIDETTTKRASSESLEALSALPEILANTHIYRQENATDAAALTKHGIAAAIIGGRPVLVRSVFKYIRQGKGGFWKYYGSKSMKLNIAKGAPASWVTKDSLRESETPFLNAPLGDNLYDWILAVKDNGKRSAILILEKE